MVGFFLVLIKTKIPKKKMEYYYSLPEHPSVTWPTSYVNKKIASCLGNLYSILKTKILQVNATLRRQNV